MAASRWQRIKKHCAEAWSPRRTLRALLPRPRPCPVCDAAAGRKSAARFAPLDGLRALALIWVLAYHSIGMSNLRGLDLSQPPPDPGDLAAAADAAAAAADAGAAASADAADMGAGMDDAGVAASLLATAELALKWVTSWQTQLWLNGYMGVDLFFTLSGFLIAHFWLKEVQATGEFRYWRFLARRFLRIWPMLMVAVFYAALVSYAYNDKAGLDACLDKWWTFALFVNNYVVSDCLGHAWSVAVEAQFYVLSPLLMWAAFSPRARTPRRFGRACLAGASLVGVAVNLGLMLGVGPSAFTMPTDWPPTWQYVNIVTRSPPYIAGMLAALAASQAGRLPQAARPASQGPEPAGTEGKPAAAANEKINRKDAAHGGSSNGAEVVAIGIAEPPAALLSAAAPAPTWRRAWRRLQGWALAVLRPEWAALVACCGLAYSGTGMNIWIEQQAPGFSHCLMVAGSWALGCCLAVCMWAMLRGRLAPLDWLLTLPALVPVAALSYSAYLLQDWPMLAFPTWAASGVSTMWAAWGTALLSLGLILGMALLVSLPFFFAVERPVAQLWPRTW